MIAKTIIAILVILNGFLLYKISTTETNDLFTQNSLYELENYRLEHFKDSARNKILKAYTGEGVFALTFINEMGCFSCIQEEIKLLNKNLNLQAKNTDW